MRDPPHIQAVAKTNHAGLKLCWETKINFRGRRPVLLHALARLLKDFRDFASKIDGRACENASFLVVKHVDTGPLGNMRNGLGGEIVRALWKVASHVFTSGKLPPKSLFDPLIADARAFLKFETDNPHRRAAP